MRRLFRGRHLLIFWISGVALIRGRRLFKEIRNPRSINQQETIKQGLLSEFEIWDWGWEGGVGG